MAERKRVMVEAEVIDLNKGYALVRVGMTKVRVCVAPENVHPFDAALIPEYARGERVMYRELEHRVDGYELRYSVRPVEKQDCGWIGGLTTAHKLIPIPAKTPLDKSREDLKMAIESRRVSGSPSPSVSLGAEHAEVLLAELEKTRDRNGDT